MFPKISLNEIQKVSIISKKNECITYRGFCRGLEVAILEITEQINPENEELYFVDFNKMFEYVNPHLVLFLGVCTEGPNWLVVTEFLPNGSLYDLITNSKELGINKMIRFGIDICQGLAWLYSDPEFQNVQSELKGNYILIDENWNCKFDFGINTIKSRFRSDREVVNETEKDAVFSFGKIFCELLLRKHLGPLEGSEQVLSSRRIAFSLDEITSPILKDIIARCISENIHNRPSFKELITILQTARIDISLPSTSLGNKIWKEEFLSKSKIKSIDLVKSLYRNLHLRDFNGALKQDALLLSALLAEKTRMYKFPVKSITKLEPSEIVVTIGTLSDLTHWFGAIGMNDYKKDSHFIRVLYFIITIILLIGWCDWYE
jgi:serine/threonine protein kinase